uniref:ATP synthase F0 subunit 8 n=1 Tax=Oxytelus piceus TaxID=1336279 RepID=UPI002A80DD40|nr:ATP synthase F0 subunit 8 [Oxytelus piceus]WON66059.1 ATP synthase F0 subunit 8 [Oxytelus piceus]
MPQMSPMNWLSLFCMFIIVFMIFNTLNYFNFMYVSKKTITKNLKKTFNWKW